MELALNLLWLVISACALAYWLRLRSEQENAPGMLRSLVVLGCAVLLLFPSISVTDDLHFSSDAVEASTFSVRKAHATSQVHHFTIAASALTLIVFFFSSERLSADEGATPRTVGLRPDTRLVRASL